MMKAKMNMLYCFAGAAMAVAANGATTCVDGVAKAIPAKTQPVIDGDLSDWDRSAPVLCWISGELADRQNAALYFQYDDANFYVGAEMALLDHDATNENRPEDRYWNGDLIQVRLCTDKSIPYPLPRLDRRNRKPDCYVGNPRVTHVNIWRQTPSGKDWLFITPGAFIDLPKAANPSGSAVKTRAGDKTLTMEARIPWTALGVEDGRCPFAPGERMPAIVDLKWAPGGDARSAVAVYRKDPGTFAFQYLPDWGQIEFAGAGEAAVSVATSAPLPTFAEIAAAAKGANAVDTRGWAKIAFDLPKRAKVSVNVFDDKGGVARELIGGEWRDAGRVEVAWDGRDALGFPCEAGKSYRWGAYAHGGLDVEYFGTVGTSGEPPYNTADGKGGWGGDHGPVVGCAADDTGRYFAWHGSESGRAVVKTDFDGRVVWRVSPFVMDGWGDYTAVASDGKRVWLAYEKRGAKATKFTLVRLSPETGAYEPFPDGRGAVELEVDGGALRATRAANAVRDEYVFNCAGIAARGGKVCVSPVRQIERTLFDD